METEFRAELHLLRKDKVVVEILQDGKLLGTIYPIKNGVKIISKYFVNDAEHLLFDLVEPPALEIVFETDETKVRKF